VTVFLGLSLNKRLKPDRLLGSLKDLDLATFKNNGVGGRRKSDEYREELALLTIRPERKCKPAAPALGKEAGR
jgi:hypothetical protein